MALDKSEYFWATTYLKQLSEQVVNKNDSSTLKSVNSRRHTFSGQTRLIPYSKTCESPLLICGNSDQGVKKLIRSRILQRQFRRSALSSGRKVSSKYSKCVSSVDHDEIANERVFVSAERIKRTKPKPFAPESNCIVLKGTNQQVKALVQK